MIKIIDNCERNVTFKDLPNQTIFKYGNLYFMKIPPFDYFIEEDEGEYAECEVNAVCINEGNITCFRDNEKVTPYKDAELILK